MKNYPDPVPKYQRFSVRLLLLLLISVFHTAILTAQVCQSSLYASYFRHNGYAYGPYADTIPGGGFILGNVGNYKKALIKADEEGNFLWGRSYDYAGATVYSDRGGGKVDKNGNYIIDVNSNALALIDPQGDVITIKTLNIRNPNNVVIYKIFVLPDNKKLVFMKDDSFYGGDAFALVCLSPDISTIVWTRYMSGGSLSLSLPNFFDSKIYIGGKTGDYGLFICLDATNGAVLKQAKYQLEGDETRTYKIYPYENGYLVTFIHNDPQVFQDHYGVMRLTNDLEIVKAYKLSNIFSDEALVLLPEPNGAYFISGGRVSIRSYISADDNILSARLSMAGYLHLPFELYKYKGGLVTVAAGNWNNVGVGTETSLGIIKTDENGIYPCSDYPNNLNFIFVNGVKTGFSVYIRDTAFITLNAETAIVNPIQYNLNINCRTVNTCSALQVEGPVSICGTGSFTYTGKRNSGCALPLQWDLIGGNAAKTKLNDSSLIINFSAAGNYRLIGSIGSNCTAISDTILITVSGSLQAPDIGPADSTLCAGNTILLNAGQGFSSYVWQDGSGNADFNVTTPGKYYVTVVSSCGATYSDTINIHAAPPVPVSIGPDRIKCNNDTLHISAPPGFLSYAWGNNYNINSLNGQSVIINPLIDTSYFIRVEKTPGCFGFDTVKIKVNNSPGINLGKDTSFCAGQSLTLHAGTAFNSYLWNNGNSTNQITVNLAGPYSVIGTTIQGCRSYDTLVVREIYVLPHVSLNKNSGICKDEVRVLNAGQHKSYLWQNGSTQSTFATSSVGKYYVEVIDHNGCKGSDTTLINIVHPVPKDFLPASLEICNYGDHSLQSATTYKNYLWSTGSSSSSISIKEGGLYWLQATDLNNCRGKDTIVVTKKQCISGLYVPTAFTPDGNGRNDKFNALLFGDIEFFDFKIFNRLGQVVFTSNNSSRGWDGSVAGLKQNSEVFVWVCNYKLKDQPAKTEKGTVLLIR